MIVWWEENIVRDFAWYGGSLGTSLTALKIVHIVRSTWLFLTLTKSIGHCTKCWVTVHNNMIYHIDRNIYMQHHGLLHPCLTAPSKSTPSKTPSQKVVKIGHPKQMWSRKSQPQATLSKILSPSKIWPKPQAKIKNYTTLSKLNSRC